MNYTYIASDTTAGNATALGTAGRDIYVKQLIFGSPTAAKITILYNKAVAYGSASGIGSVDSSNIAFKYTQPTAAAGNDIRYELTFAGEGLQLDGGSVHTDDTDTTVIWEYVDEAKG